MLTETSGKSNQGKGHDGYLSIATAKMSICSCISIFIINAQAGGYANENGYPWTLLESTGVIFAGALIGYLVFIWRSATRGYSYNSW